MKELFLLAGLSLLILLTACSSTSFATPQLINYQGKLSDSQGQPVSDGDYDIVFGLFYDYELFEQAWAESLTVAVSGGLFSVYLGEVNELDPAIVSNAPWLSLVVDGERIDPPMLLSQSPGAFTAQRVSGDVVSDDSTFYVPGNVTRGWTKAVELARSDFGGRIGIWGTDGTALPQVEMITNFNQGQLLFHPDPAVWTPQNNTALALKQNEDGSSIELWGNDGSTSPQVTLQGSSVGGMMSLWRTDDTPLPQIEISGSASGGAFDLYGENAAIGSQIRAFAAPGGGTVGVFFPTRAGDIPRVEMEGFDGGGRLGIWGTNGTSKSSYEMAEMSADSNGGVLTLRDSSGQTKMTLDGSADGDQSVTLPGDAISSSEVFDEPGIAQSFIGSCSYLSSTTMVDLIVLNVEIPTSGYIYLTGHALIELSNTTADNRIDIQIDQTEGGGLVSGHHGRVGLTSYAGTSYHDFDVNVRRMYFKDAGTHQFRLEAARLSTNGNARICYPTLTAMFFPTSYGTVTSIVGEPGGMPDAKRVSGELPGGVTDEGATYEVDLRNYEIRAREARERALEAELELQSARDRAEGRNRLDAVER